MNLLKYIFATTLFTLLTSCTTPQLYSSTQELYLYDFSGIPDAKVIYENNEYNSIRIPIKRSYFDKEIIIQKDGYEDYHLKLKSHWTDEKWANSNDCNHWIGHVSAWHLLLPENTIKSIQCAPLFLPTSILLDAYNVVIGAPSTLIINPWRKMTWNKNIILKPTDKLKEECHKNKNSFISNHGCIDCNLATIPTARASHEECSRCKHRTYFKEESICLFTPAENVEQRIKEECHKKGLMYTKIGCMTCDKIGKIDTHGIGIGIRNYLPLNECKRCPNFHGKEDDCYINLRQRYPEIPELDGYDRYYIKY